MVRRIDQLFAVSAILGLSGLGCASDGAKDKPTTPAVHATAEPSDPPEPTPEPAPPAEPKKDDRPAPVGDDYIMSHSDCEALAGAYQRAWQNDELAKLQGDTLSAQARANVEAAAKQGGDSWLASCRGIVGSPQVRDNLGCALKAKSIERFDKCMAGLAE